jgi:signal transduction histidine kinase/DNA-binding NarL/FixJ family response regulator
VCLVGGWASGGVTAQAQSGRPFLQTISAATYKAHPQNFDVATGPEGRLFAANARGVLVHDGARWSLTTLPNEGPARSLAHGPDGTLYVGAQGDLGRLERSAEGRWRFVSLRSQLPHASDAVGAVWRTHAVPEGIFFGTETRLYRWNGTAMTTWDGSFGLSFAPREAVYVQSTDGTLSQVKGDRLVPVPGLGALKTVFATLPIGDRDVLFLTRDGGVRYRPSAGTRQPWRPEAHPALQKAGPYNGVRLPGGGVAVATQTGGVFVYAADGTLRHRVDRTTGLRDNSVYALALDAKGGLWLAQGRGLARVATHLPLSRYGVPEGVEGSVLDVARWNDRLYVGTMEGLFVQRAAPGPGRPARFERLPAPAVVHALLPLEDALLGATAYGLFRHDARGPTPLNLLPHRVPQASDLIRAGPRSSRVYVGWQMGVSVLRRTADGWAQTRHLTVDAAVSRLALAPDGALWAGTETGPLWRIPPGRLAGRAPDVPIARYDTTHGLPSLRYNAPYRLPDRLVVGTTDGPYRFEAAANRFVPDTTLRAPLPHPDRYAGPIVPAADGSVWMHVGEAGTPTTGRLLPASTDTAARWQTGALHRLTGFTAYAIAPTRSAVWIGGPGQGPETLLVRYAPPPAVPPGPSAAPGPPALLHRATVPGADTSIALRTASAERTPPLLPPFSSLRVEYGAPAFDRPDATTYRLRLRHNGAPSKWSPWRDASETTFSELGAGRYVFEVQAQDVYRRTGPPAALAFRVAPPWYRTIWAYLGYGLGALGLVGGLIALRTRHLRQRERTLKDIVAARTEEVRSQARKLETQRDQIARQADDLRELDRAKSRFFANLSHEFRTPLTLLLGPIQQLRDRLRNTEAFPALSEGVLDRLDGMERNARRLLHRVEQLLKLAQHDAGTLTLQARPIDLAARTEETVRAFDPLAEQRRIALSLAPVPAAPAAAAPVYLDPDHFHQILANLLSNALTYTPEGGRVTVRLAPAAEAVALTVTDTGPGLSETLQARMFDRFAQGASAHNEGVGIGLALTQTLVDLHSASLTVDSTVGEGTAFTIRFLRGRDHLSDDQIAPEPAASPPTPPLLAVPQAPGQNASSSPPASPDAPLVLVVDDNPDVCTYVASVLAPSYRTCEAATGKEGVHAARTRLPDLVLADVMMPEMDGIAMTQALRDDPRTQALPVLLLTARAGTEDEVKGRAAGAVDYITKPFAPDVLEMRVRGLLAYQQRLRRHLLRVSGDALPGPARASSPPSTSPGAPPRLSSLPDDASFEEQVRAGVWHGLPDPQFDVAALCQALSMSRSTLYRRMRATDLPSPATFIRSMRLQRAHQLLGTHSVIEVAYAVGYNSLSNFSTQYREHFGTAPSNVAAPDSTD